MKILKNFVVFEGGDGSGTTTQLTLLKDSFHQNSQSLALPPLHITAEPTNGCIGKLIRSVLRKEITLQSETTARLFAADRNEHLYERKGIAERCASGELVVSDRYVPSSLVYQGLLCGEETPEKLNADFPSPELLLFFDVDPEVAQQRMETRDTKELYEYLEFQIEVRARYKSLLPRFENSGVRVEVIDACKPIDEVARTVWRHLQKLPIMKA